MLFADGQSCVSGSNMNRMRVSCGPSIEIRPTLKDLEETCPQTHEDTVSGQRESNES